MNGRPPWLASTPTKMLTIDEEYDAMIALPEGPAQAAACMAVLARMEEDSDYDDLDDDDEYNDDEQNDDEDPAQPEVNCVFLDEDPQ